jgi:hypothetical protein
MVKLLMFKFSFTFLKLFQSSNFQPFNFQILNLKLTTGKYIY